MYDYEKEKKYVFTDTGQRHFLFIRDLAHSLLKQSGAFMINKVTILAPSIGAASNWEMMACVDRLLELGEIEEIPTKGKTGRIFILPCK